jgi:hydroxymethylglutaryl-CoA reductase (NADPH)
MTGKTHTPESRSHKHSHDDIIDTVALDSAYRNSALRRFLHILATATTQHPIESISLCLVVASFAYFTLFNTIRHSTFFDANNVVVYQPTTVIAHPGQSAFQHFDRRFSKIPRNAQQLQLKQVVVTPDSSVSSLIDTDSTSMKNSVLASVLQLQTMIEDQVLVSPIQLWDRDLQSIIQDGKVLATVTENTETIDYLFKDLRSTVFTTKVNNSRDTIVPETPALVLSYAFDANGPFQSRLAQGWESKVAHLDTPTMRSQSRLLEDEKSALAWIGSALLDVAHKIQGLVQVRNYLIIQSFQQSNTTTNNCNYYCTLLFSPLALYPSFRRSVLLPLSLVVQTTNIQSCVHIEKNRKRALLTCLSF